MNMFQQGAFQVKPGTSPEQLEKRRQIISQMLSGTGSARYAGEGLANLATNVAGGIQRRNLDNYETGQRNSAAESVTQAPNSSAQDLRALLSNPWLSPQQKQMVAKQLQQAEVRAASAAGAPGYSRGTESARGGTAIVGENGPEVVQMPKGAKVIPNNQLAELVTDQNGIMRYNEPVQPDDYFRNELGEDKYQRYLRMDDAGRLEYLNDPANGFLPYGHGDSYDPNPIDPRSIFDTNNRFNDAASYQTADMSGIDPSGTGERSQLNAAARSFQGLMKSLDDYEALFKKGGATMWPGERKSRLDTAHRDLQMLMKELYNLGVLNGPDLGIMDQVLLSPTSVSGNLMDAVGISDMESRIPQNIEDVRRMMINRTTPALQQLGIDPESLMPKKEPADAGDDDGGWTEINGVKIRVKQ